MTLEEVLRQLEERYRKRQAAIDAADPPTFNKPHLARIIHKKGRCSFIQLI